MAWRLAKSLEKLRAQVNDRWPGRDKSSDGSIGDESHSARTSDHNPNDDGVVCAIDITHDPRSGCDAGVLAEKLRASRDPRIKYLISNKRICNSAATGGKPAWAWRPYTGKNPHDHHVHISVKGDYDNTSPWDLDAKPDAAPKKDAPPPPPVLKKGSKGGEVIALQVLLKVKADGKFGPATDAAVRSFQRRMKLVDDGIVGPATWKAFAA